MSVTTPVDSLADALDRAGCGPVRNGMWRCPAHEDSTASLSVSTGLLQPAVMHCHAGCTPDDILNALGLTWADISKPTERRQAEADITYSYVDEAGALLYQKVRKPGKRFLQRRPEGHGGWIWKLDDDGIGHVTRRVLYRLPAVLEAIAADRLVWLCEGEKDADALQRHLAPGEVATTMADGAKDGTSSGKWGWRPEYTATLAGAVVMVVADRDPTGIAHARHVAAELEAADCTVIAVQPRAGKDAHDHLTAGHGPDDFDPLDEHQAEPVVADPPAESETRTTWAPVDLDDLDNDTTAALPRYLRRSDGVALLYAGKVHTVSGEPESGKSWLAQWAAAQEIAAGNNVAIIDFEDSARPVVERLEGFGLTRAQIVRHLCYLSPSEPLGDRQGRITPALLDLTATLDAWQPVLVILDGVTAAMTLEGLDPNSNSDIAQWWTLLPRYIASRGAAVLQVDHVTKDREGRGRWAIGGQHKLAAVDGAAFTVDIVHPFVRGGDGEARISISKDRPGHVRPHAAGKTVATFHLTSDEDGTITADLRAPEERRGSFRPTTIMERVSRALEGAPAGFTKNSLRAAVSGNNGAIDVAVDLLIGEGYIVVERDGQAHRHVSVKPFRADDDGQEQAP